VRSGRSDVGSKQQQNPDMAKFKPTGATTLASPEMGVAIVA